MDGVNKPVIISPFIFHAGYVEGRFKQNVLIISIEKILLSFHKLEEKMPNEGS